MPSQPTTLSVPAAVLLGVAAVSAATLTVIIAVQSIVPLRVYEGATSLLAALLALTGTGVIICTAADRVMRRLDRLEAKLDEQKEQGYAEGFVAAAAGGRHLTAVRQG